MKPLCFSLVIYFALSSSSFAQIDVKTFTAIHFSSKPNDIAAYIQRLQNIVSNPKELDALSPYEISALLGRLNGCHVLPSLKPDDATKVRQLETLVTGLGIQSLYKRIDPTIYETAYVTVYKPLPYEQVANPEDINNEVKRKVYDQKVAETLNNATYIDDQVRIKKYFKELIHDSKGSLELLYKTSSKTDNEEMTLLQKTGLDPKIIKQLMAGD